MSGDQNIPTPELDMLKQIRIDAKQLLEAELRRGRTLVAVNHVSKYYVYPENGPPEEDDFVAYGRMIRRRASCSPDLVRLLAVIEVSLNEEAGLRAYQIGLHGVAVVSKASGAKGFEACKAIVKEAISRTDDGHLKTAWGHPNDIAKPFTGKPIHDREDGLQGWLNYMSKSFELGPVVRRCRYRGPSGKRHSKKVWATGPQSRAVAEILSDVVPQKRLILVGYKRFQGQLRAVSRKVKRFT